MIQLLTDSSETRYDFNKELENHSDTDDGHGMKIEVEWQPVEMREIPEEKAFVLPHCPSHMIRVELPLQRRFIFFQWGWV